LAVALHRAGVIGWLGRAVDAAETPHQAPPAPAAHAPAHPARRTQRTSVAAAAPARDARLRAAIAASWANLVLATEDRVEEAMALADVAETWATEPTALVGCRTARAR